jgi:cysteine synthase A
MLPDTGERYLSTPLFDDINTEMNEEEMVISCSTPACRFDVTEPEADEADQEVVEVAEEVDLDQAAIAEVDAVLSANTNQLVVLLIYSTLVSQEIWKIC